MKLGDVWEYDIQKQQWTQLPLKVPPNQPSTTIFLVPAKNSACFTVGNRICIYGGETFSFTKVLNDFLIYDTMTHMLSRAGDVQDDTGFTGHSIAWLGDKLLILGGNNVKNAQHVCTVSLENSLCGTMLTRGNVFGAPLSHIMKQQAVFYPKEKWKVPLLVEKTTKFLMENGIDSEGIFRKSGRYTEVVVLQLYFENWIPLDDSAKFDCNSIAVILKRFMASLPEPLLTFDLYDSFLECMESEDVDYTGTLDKIKELLQKLPEVNYEVVKRVCQVLSAVVDNKKTSLMEPNNLTIIMGQSFCSPKDSTKRSNLADSVVQLLLKEYGYIFEKQVIRAMAVTSTPSTSKRNSKNKEVSHSNPNLLANIPETSSSIGMRTLRVQEEPIVGSLVDERHSGYLSVGKSPLGRIFSHLKDEDVVPLNKSDSISNSPVVNFTPSPVPEETASDSQVEEESTLSKQQSITRRLDSTGLIELTESPLQSSDSPAVIISPPFMTIPTVVGADIDKELNLMTNEK